MGNKRNIQASQKSSESPKKTGRSRKSVNDIKKGGNSIRIIQERRVKHGCCYDQERQKGIGAVLFTLGIPSLITGLIMTIVSATDSDSDNKYPKTFIAVGPILLVLSVFFFFSGILLHSSYVRQACQDCFSLDDPKGFCRVRCPNLSQFLWPDDSIAINEAAIKALKSEPGKSVLKRNRLLSDPTTGHETNYNFPSETSPETDDVFDEENVSRVYNHAKIRLPKGVHFSDGDVDDARRKRAGSNGSVLSLKHCKISPKDEIWWTDENKTKTVQVNAIREESIQTTEL